MACVIARRLFGIIFMLAVTATCLFGSAGRLDWPNAWVLLALSFASGVVSTAVLWNNPDLMAERTTNAKAGKSWDKVIVAFCVLFGPMATWITAGLDARFHWSKPMSPWTFYTSVLVAVLAISMIAWSMKTNTFFSSVVRIQRERGHSVIMAGPYRVVRHPGYVGMAAFTLVTPLILNSRWAFVPALATVSLMVLRTALEDRTLHSELEGYAAYAHRVRYKLVPGIW
jgi:protein-S-isoprenylcysteine O-methyltransferase Ste14